MYKEKSFKKLMLLLSFFLILNVINFRCGKENLEMFGNI